MRQNQSSLLGFLALCASVAMATDSTSHTVHESTPMPLNSSDVQEIEGLVLAENPVLASSPGIKDISTNRFSLSGRQARVIWYPHYSSGGVEEAFQVSCQQVDSGLSWTCEPATIRRYLNIQTQDFAVRLLCDTSPDTAVALIEATRHSLSSLAPEHSDWADTALTIFRQNDSFVVVWGRPDRDETVDLQARLEEGGDPTNPADWQIGLFLPDRVD